MTLAQGSIIYNGRYRIAKLIGQGGMGAVYRAWDTSLNKAVALKENTETAADAQRQFLREAHILARLTHPNLPRVTDYFSIPGQGEYLVMDFVEGEDLESICKRQGSLPEQQVLMWVAQICDALSYLHRQEPPIIHRDVKPANIKITPNGTAVLVDFGIAKSESTGVTGTGARAVTPGYSPPEQYLQTGTSPRSDVYALGATLYRLLLGEELPESINRMVSTQPGSRPPVFVQPPVQRNPAVSQRTSLVVMKAIELDAWNRFPSVDEMKKALPLRGNNANTPLPQVQQPPVRPAPAPGLPTVVKPPAKKRTNKLPLAVSGGCFLLLILCVGAGVVLWPSISDWAGAFPLSNQPSADATSADDSQPAQATDQPVVDQPAAGAPIATLTAIPTPDLAQTEMVLTAAALNQAATQDASTSLTQAAGQALDSTPTPHPDAVYTYAAKTVSAQLTSEAFTPTPPPPNPSGPARDPQGLLPGEPWEVEGVEFIVSRIEIFSQQSGSSAAAHVSYTFFNKTGQKVLVEWNTQDIYLEDSSGNRYVDYYEPEAISTWVDPLGRWDFDRYYSSYARQESKIPIGTTFVKVVVPAFSRIRDVSWKLAINPAQESLAWPEAGTYRSVGEAWTTSDLSLTLQELNITASNGGSAAVEAKFVLTNISSRRLLVVLDYAYFFCEDSFANYFRDYYGGDLQSTWLDPGGNFDFTRYYTSMMREESRISVGSEFVLLTIEKLEGFANIKWLLPINR